MSLREGNLDLPEFNLMDMEPNTQFDDEELILKEKNLLSPYIKRDDINGSDIFRKKDNSAGPSVFPLPNGPQVASNPNSSNRTRKKVGLEPGHSPLDWARLTTSGQDLRGVDQLKLISLNELKLHKTEEDAWCAINGKVYNITPYKKFHPGGIKQLMKGAGKDASALYNKVHPWVNVDSLLKECMVGFYQPQ